MAVVPPQVSDAVVYHIAETSLSTAVQSLRPAVNMLPESEAVLVEEVAIFSSVYLQTSPRPEAKTFVMISERASKAAVAPLPSRAARTATKIRMTGFQSIPANPDPALF